MISKSKLKIVKSLNYKKNRLNSNCFVIEGIKGIIEVLKSNLDKKLVSDVESLDRSSSKVRSLKERRLDKLERKYSLKS